ncbi:GntR family transcriptional regulator [Planifilum fimeticola]|uniref:GntR family transcriptional regulator n=1 Tax=Planifilum fimeticola TaxID=201975 RepID=A0A2T0LB06_9BACL|nr:GntR family transcriptional regulator [Planifilum fimeticola]PRX39025.1 GntR family transcriptional regulator [Planifilum fimeticola]
MDERQVGSLTFYLDLSQPLYEQILQQMRNAIVKGEMALGEKIPSVRDMARALKVNPNTVIRAYQELERDGLTETRRGQGTFITTSQERVERIRNELAQHAIEEFLEKMQSLGYSWEEIERCLQDKKKEDTADDPNRRSL